MPQTANLGLPNMNENNKKFNQLLLIFEMHVYKNKRRGVSDLENLINEIIKDKPMENRWAVNNTKKLVNYNKNHEVQTEK